MKNITYYIIPVIFMLISIKILFEGVTEANNSKLMAGIFLCIIIPVVVYYYKHSISQDTKVIIDNFMHKHKYEINYNSELSHKYSFNKLFYTLSIVSLIIMIICSALIFFRFKWPTYFLKIFYAWETALVFLMFFIFSLLLLIFIRNQTGYICFDNEKFEIHNRLFIGANYKAEWILLDKIILQRLQYSSLNFIIHFKGKPMLALTENTQEFKHYILNMVTYLISNGMSDKISAQHLGSSRSINSLKLETVLNWLAK